METTDFTLLTAVLAALVIPLHAELSVEDTPLMALLTVDVILLHAELNPVVMLSTIPEREVLTAETTLFTASVKAEFPLIPFAMVSIMSEPQLSASESGPSSGTEKCRKERILSAMPVTASATP